MPYKICRINHKSAFIPVASNFRKNLLACPGHDIFDLLHGLSSLLLLLVEEGIARYAARVWEFVEVLLQHNITNVTSTSTRLRCPWRSLRISSSSSTGLSATTTFYWFIRLKATLALRFLLLPADGESIRWLLCYLMSWLADPFAFSTPSLFFIFKRWARRHRTADSRSLRGWSSWHLSSSCLSFFWEQAAVIQLLLPEVAPSSPLIS